MQPATGLARIAGDKQDAIRPACSEMVGIVHAVGIEETITIRDLITPAARAKKIKSSPESKFVNKKLEEADRPRTLAKAIGIRDNNYLARNSQHFADDGRGIGNVVKRRKFADASKVLSGKGRASPPARSTAAPEILPEARPC